ncbi:MAG: serine/threonine-protein kinase [Rhodanobacteraceae bacterium]
MTFDAESAAAVRAAHVLFHGNEVDDDAPIVDSARIEGLLQPGGALAGRVFSRLLGDAHDDPPLAPGTRVGAWRIGRILGCGGSAIVYLADRADGHFDQEVALKVLRPRPELIERFRRERQILAGLRHPAIARLIDGGEIEGGRLWFAMEPVFGERIDDHVRSRRLPLDARLSLFEAVCEAVAYAHRRQLVHRDIKPANVLVDEAGKPRLLDFGIATADDAGDEGDRAMTPNYASPEQRLGSAVTPASDIFQLGTILREIVACCTPLPRKAARGIDAIVAKATETDPARRYGRVAVLWSDVVALRERRDISVLPPWRERMLQLVERRAPRVATVARELATAIAAR